MKDIIVLSDLHLTSNKADEYRWEWLDKFKDYLVEHKDKTPLHLIICGDLTEKKDAHPEVLVTRLTNNIRELSSMFEEIVILSGNHDGVVSDKPFFSFLSLIPKVKFITSPTVDGSIVYLPHTRTPIEDWKDVPLDKARYIFMHQTVSTAIAANNYRLTSQLPYDYFSAFPSIREVFSGDVHKPQELGIVTYIGAPYHVYFGDSYEGRYLLLKNFSGNRFYQKLSVSIPTINKWKLNIGSIKELNSFAICKNDQVSIEYTIEITEQHDWVNIRDYIRKYINNKGAVLCSLVLVVNKHDRSLDSEYTKIKTTNELPDEQVVSIYINRNKLDDSYYRVALEIMGDQNVDT